MKKEQYKAYFEHPSAKSRFYFIIAIKYLVAKQLKKEKCKLNEIAEILGVKDHSTIVSLLNSKQDKMVLDEVKKYWVEWIEKCIYPIPTDIRVKEGKRNFYKRWYKI